jgi:hypothetical protein
MRKHICLWPLDLSGPACCFTQYVLEQDSVWHLFQWGSISTDVVMCHGFVTFLLIGGDLNRLIASSTFKVDDPIRTCTYVVSRFVETQVTDAKWLGDLSNRAKVLVVSCCYF